MSRWRMNDLNQQGVRLNSDILDLRPFVRREGEVLLARDVLDKQLIDVDGKRVVRVNDVQIIEAAGEWRVTGADVQKEIDQKKLDNTYVPVSWLWCANGIFLLERGQGAVAAQALIKAAFPDPNDQWQLRVMASNWESARRRGPSAVRSAPTSTMASCRATVTCRARPG